MNAFGYNTDSYNTLPGPMRIQGEGATPADAMDNLNGKIALNGKNPVLLYLETVTGVGKFYCIALVQYPLNGAGQVAIIGGNTTI